jgi:two-component system NtrC family sensor kinase
MLSKDTHNNLRKILVVDDNPDIHHDFRTILDHSKKSIDTASLDQLEAEILGRKATSSDLTPRYQLSFAFQGQEAVKMVEEAIGQHDPFQLAFVDMRMPPGWDGLETIERIWHIDRQIQIVLCTAYSDYSWEQIEQHLRRTENLLILKKPFDVSEVAQMANTLSQKWLLTKAAQMKQDELEAVVQQRTRELQQTNAKLNTEIEERRQLAKQLIRAQKMEAIGTLAAGVAHDLNNILSGIVSYPDLLLHQIDPQNPIHPRLKLIQQSGRKAAAIVQDMLTLGRRVVTNQEPVDLRAVVAEYIQSPEWTKTQSYYSSVLLETQFDSHLSSVNGTEVQIVKCLMNLVSNAAEAMPDGGKIAISLKERHLAEAYIGYESIPPGHYVSLRVSDSGKGISSQDLEHIFEPFYTKKKMGRSGTGLGLAVVWGVVRDHNGFLDVQSRPGEGTVIDLYFPACERRTKVAASSEAANLLAERAHHVLVVDDVIEQRQIAAEMLVALGYSADAVPSGEAALAYLEKQPVDLLLLDMAMDPGIDGLETYQRAVAIHPGQRAIIASGFTKNERVQKALALGAAAFLNKPYRLKDLAEAVKQALSSKVM